MPKGISCPYFLKLGRHSSKTNIFLPTIFLDNVSVCFVSRPKSSNFDATFNNPFFRQYFTVCQFCMLACFIFLLSKRGKKLEMFCDKKNYLQMILSIISFLIFLIFYIFLLVVILYKRFGQ
jgi:hypothetical protein